jgi:hypothetical protein
VGWCLECAWVDNVSWRVSQSLVRERGWMMWMQRQEAIFRLLWHPIGRTCTGTSGETVALAIWSKDRRDVEDRLEFFSRASNGGLPCLSELVDPGPPFLQFSFLLRLTIPLPAPPFPLLPGPVLAVFKNPHRCLLFQLLLRVLRYHRLARQ